VSEQVFLALGEFFAGLIVQAVEERHESSLPGEGVVDEKILHSI